MRSGVSVRFGISFGKLNQEIVSDHGCFFGILSLEKAFEPGFWSEITITDLLKAKMAAH